MNTKKVFYLLIILAFIYNLLMIKSCNSISEDKQKTTLSSNSNQVKTK